MSHSTERLSGEQTRRSLIAFNANAASRSFYDTVCGGATFVFVSCALALGLQDRSMGLITGLVSLACILQLVSLALASRVRNMKSFIITLALIESLALVVSMFLLPWLPASMRLAVLVGALFIAAASLQLNRPFGDNWLATTIPAVVRSRYLGKRFQVISLATIIGLLAAGWAADRIGKENATGLALLMGVGGLFGVAAVIFLSRADMPELSATSRVTLRDFIAAFKIRPFRHYLIGTFVFNMPFFMVVPYYRVYDLSVLQMKASWISYMICGYYFMRIVTTSFWSRMIERHGARWVIWACTPIYMLFFLSFQLNLPGRVWPDMLAWTMVGVADCAFSIAVTASLYASVPETPSRPAYFAIANMLGTGCQGLAALLGVPLLGLLGAWGADRFYMFFGLAALMLVPASFGARYLAPPFRIEAPVTEPDSGASPTPG